MSASCCRCVSQPIRLGRSADESCCVLQAVLARRQEQQPLPGPPPRPGQTPTSSSTTQPSYAYKPAPQQPAYPQQPTYTHPASGTLSQLESKGSAGYNRPQYSAPRYLTTQYSPASSGSWPARLGSAPGQSQQYPTYAYKTGAYAAQPYSYSNVQSAAVPERVDPRRHTNASHSHVPQGAHQQAHPAWQTGSNGAALPGQGHDRNNIKIGHDPYSHAHSQAPYAYPAANLHAPANGHHMLAETTYGPTSKPY